MAHGQWIDEFRKYTRSKFAAYGTNYGMSVVGGGQRRIRSRGGPILTHLPERNNLCLISDQYTKLALHGTL